MKKCKRESILFVLVNLTMISVGILCLMLGFIADYFMWSVMWNYVGIGLLVYAFNCIYKSIKAKIRRLRFHRKERSFIEKLALDPRKSLTENSSTNNHTLLVHDIANQLDKRRNSAKCIILFFYTKIRRWLYETW